MLNTLEWGIYFLLTVLTPNCLVLQVHLAISFYQSANTRGLQALYCRMDEAGTSSSYTKSTEMQIYRVCALFMYCLLMLDSVTSAPSPQEPAFELPVQLVGFPVIIAAVRITNFIKKLAYSLNPQTYMSRMKRADQNLEEIILDVAQVEKKLVAEMGERVCIYENICSKYAEISLKQSQSTYQDFNEIFSSYKTPTNFMKENYLLSVFLGEIVRSPTLCHQLAKRGRACDETTVSD